MDEDRYEENAISELQIICKVFKRKFIEFENYYLPLTIELTSVGSEKPIGIRVSAYEPLKGVHVGLFIYINLGYWNKIQKEDRLFDSRGNEIVKDGPQVHQYTFEKESFLTQWLREEGFEKIFSRVVINNRSLEIKGMTGKYYRLQDLV